jgi:hypothetical protein
MGAPLGTRYVAIARRRALLLCFGAMTSGCGLLEQPVAIADPTGLEPPIGPTVEVAVDNRSSEELAVTISQGGQLGPSLIVAPCQASNFINPAVGPFTVGMGPVSELPDRPMPPLVESSRLEMVEGRYRLLVRVAPDGEVTFGPLEGVAPLRAGGC